MNTVIYARFSSHSQTEQSIEGQLKTCYDFAQKNGYTVLGEYIDRAISGTTDNRPEFKRMIEDSSKKRFQYILVYQLDRFARNRYDSATYKAKLKKNGVRVLSARENISDDASGILMEGLLESMAEYYSAELSQKIKRGMDLNAQKCLCTGGNVALGYKVDENKKFIIDDTTATIVKKIFELYSSGQRITQINEYLNTQQIKTSRNFDFNKNSLRKLLTNKRYIGIYTYNGTEIKDGMPRIIEDELFYKVGEMMEKNKKAPATSNKKQPASNDKK
jgi:DNA invertase Pin-like site-specific DNA recombinase